MWTGRKSKMGRKNCNARDLLSIYKEIRKPLPPPSRKFQKERRRRTYAKGRKREDYLEDYEWED